MSINPKIVDAFNSIVNDSEFTVNDFVQLCENTIKQPISDFDKKRIYHFLKDSISNETEVIQSGRRGIAFIFKKKCDTALDAFQIRMENYKKLARSKYIGKSKKRVRSMEKAPATLQASDGVPVWKLTNLEWQTIQQKFELAHQVVKNLKDEISELINENQQLAAELRGRQEAQNLQTPDLSCFQKDF